MFRSFGFVEVADGHFRQLDFHSLGSVSLDGRLHIGDDGGIQAAALGAVAAHIALHTDTVDEGTGVAFFVLCVGLDAPGRTGYSRCRTA